MIPKDTPRGTLVILSAEAARNGIHQQRKNRTGVFKGYTSKGDSIKVIPDGTKTVGIYHPDYWDLYEFKSVSAEEFAGFTLRLENHISTICDPPRLEFFSPEGAMVAYCYIDDIYAIKDFAMVGGRKLSGWKILNGS